MVFWQKCFFRAPHHLENIMIILPVMSVWEMWVNMSMNFGCWKEVIGVWEKNSISVFWRRLKTWENGEGGCCWWSRAVCIIVGPLDRLLECQCQMSQILTARKIKRADLAGSIDLRRVHRFSGVPRFNYTSSSATLFDSIGTRWVNRRPGEGGGSSAEDGHLFCNRPVRLRCILYGPRV